MRSLLQRILAVFVLTFCVHGVAQDDACGIRVRASDSESARLRLH